MTRLWGRRVPGRANSCIRLANEDSRDAPTIMPFMAAEAAAARVFLCVLETP